MNHQAVLIQFPRQAQHSSLSLPASALENEAATIVGLSDFNESREKALIEKYKGLSSHLAQIVFNDDHVGGSSD